jgi:iron-sulfur cluster assembly accessory protein
MQLKVTDNAFKRVGELIALENNTNNVLRISVNGGGCSGFTYQYELISSSEILNDDFIEEKNGIRIVVDQVSQEFMNNCIVDYVEELGSSYFDIKNPKATARCGCGNSFSV